MLPQSLPKTLDKRAPGDVVKFAQCAGTYPITLTEITYSPAIWEPGKNITEHIVGVSTIPIEEGAMITLNVHQNNELLFTFTTDYCVISAAHNEPCPVKAGPFDQTNEWLLEETAKQPKAMTVEYFIKVTLESKDNTTLSCEEGNITVKYP